MIERARASAADLRIDALGSGSDYSPFLQHAGIASLNLGFGGEDGGGIYHSIYDDFYFFTRFLDTDFVYGRALAQTVGTAVIRLADSDVLPFEFTNLADTVEKYVKELNELLKQKQGDIRERNRQIQDGVFAAIADPRLPQPAPKLEVVPPAINFAPLENASTALTDSARRYERHWDRRAPRSPATPPPFARSTRGFEPPSPVDRRRGPARPPVVPASAVRARLVHRDTA